MKGALTVLLVVAVAFGAAACTGDAEVTGRADRGPAVTATHKPAPAFTGVRHRLPKGKALRNDPDLYRTVAVDGCEKTGAGWRASGTVDNSVRKGRYSILVFFTDAQARTVDFARAKVDAAARTSTRWTASKAFKSPAEVNCVVRAVTHVS